MKSFLLLLAAFALATMACPATAHFIQPQDVPVARLLKAAETYLAGHPAEAEAHYTLARIHYLAFARGAENVPAFRDDEGGKPTVPGDWLIDFDVYEARRKHAAELALKDIGERGPEPPPEKVSSFEEARGRRGRQLEAQNWLPRGRLPPAQMLAHAVAAAAEFHTAMNLDGKNGLYHLGLASLSEQFADWAAGIKPAALPPELRVLTLAGARDAYLRAFRMAIAGDAGLPTLPVSGLPSLVSHEAGEAYLRLAEHEPGKGKARERGSIEEVKAGLKKLKRLRIGAITPIVFSVHREAHLRTLLAPHNHVSFDLRGFGPPQSWPWVKATTGFLVWDPAGTGHITSARQLFGQYTFEIFRPSGYDALAALDENGDGQLSGAELSGLRVWFDRNGDGHSSPGEVRDLCEFGITSIAVRATGRDGRHPTNGRGITLQNGRQLPTWDWIAMPAR